MNARKYIKLVIGGSSIVAGIGLAIGGFIGFIIPELASSAIGIGMIVVGFFLFLFGMGLLGIKTKKIVGESADSTEKVTEVVKGSVEPSTVVTE